MKTLKVVLATLIVLLLTYSAWAKLPWTTMQVADVLEKAGFVMMGIDELTFWMKAPGPVVAKVSLNRSGRMLVTGVGFNGRNMDAVYHAMVAYYVYLQADMGKAMSYDPTSVKILTRKMQRLEDTIAHNLKLNAVTQFTYDDLDVRAWATDSGYVVIEFRPEF